MKKNNSSKVNVIVPLYTPQQIINSVNVQMQSEKNLKSENSHKDIVAS